MYSGQAAIDYLATEVSKNDPGESSHWRKYHSAFKFTGSGFEGLQGFGGIQQPYSGPRLWLHLLLQRPFRRMGITFPKFKLIDKLARDITTRQLRGYDLDVLRQVLTLSFLNKYAPNALQSQATVCVIGDGFASMTALLLASSSAGRVVLINLTKQCSSISGISSFGWAKKLSNPMLFWCRIKRSLCVRFSRRYPKVGR